MITRVTLLVAASGVLFSPVYYSVFSTLDDCARRGTLPVILTSSLDSPAEVRVEWCGPSAAVALALLSSWLATRMTGVAGPPLVLIAAAAALIALLLGLAAVAIEAKGVPRGVWAAAGLSLVSAVITAGLYIKVTTPGP